MKAPVKIAVTGAAGNISYSLLFRIAAGDLFGMNQPVALYLLEIPPAMETLNGVVMELNDCAFPLLQRTGSTDNPEIAFEDIDFAFLVGARPRGAGMERNDLLTTNAEIFSVQGKALNGVAKRDAKIVVAGNPANTNALIAIHNAPDLNPNQFSAMMRLDHNRAIGQLANKCGVAADQIKKMTVWGNHSSTQYPDIHHALVEGNNATTLVEQSWFADDFIPTVQKRGAAIIKARGSSSAASAANAAIDHMRNWVFGTPDDDWVSMAVASDGSYGIEEGIVYSYPVTVENGVVHIIKGLEINQFSREKMAATEAELKEEREAVKHLL